MIQYALPPLSRRGRVQEWRILDLSQPQELFEMTFGGLYHELLRQAGNRWSVEQEDIADRLLNALGARGKRGRQPSDRTAARVAQGISDAERKRMRNNWSAWLTRQKRDEPGPQPKRDVIQVMAETLRCSRYTELCLLRKADHLATVEETGEVLRAVRAPLEALRSAACVLDHRLNVVAWNGRLAEVFGMEGPAGADLGVRPADMGPQWHWLAAIFAPQGFLHPATAQVDQSIRLLTFARAYWHPLSLWTESAAWMLEIVSACRAFPTIVVDGHKYSFDNLWDEAGYELLKQLTGPYDALTNSFQHKVIQLDYAGTNLRLLRKELDSDPRFDTVEFIEFERDKATN